MDLKNVEIKKNTKLQINLKLITKEHLKKQWEKSKDRFTVLKSDVMVRETVTQIDVANFN